MSQWLTPSESSSPESSKSSSSKSSSMESTSQPESVNATDTVEGLGVDMFAGADASPIDPGLPAPDRASSVTVEYGGYDNNRPDRSYQHTEQTYAAAGQQYGAVRYPRPGSDSMSVVGIVLAAGASALAVAILLAMFLRHDGIDNQQRLFPGVGAAAAHTTATTNIHHFSHNPYALFLDGELS